jgi:D-3-phosphoglycerate dehydrogenase
VRFLQDSNHKMRTDGSTRFNELKKNYSAGIELKGKTLGIIGFGRIGQAVAKMGIGLGMRVIASDPFIEDVILNIHILQTGADIPVKIKTISVERLLSESDFVSIHVPGKVNGKAVIAESELRMMKKGAGIVNASRGGVIDEDALLLALDRNQLSFAGLDVFENEPTPRTDLLYHPKISVTPHIGASTVEAQERIGIEMAENIITFFSQA